jgi:hypothetical protein
MLNQILCPHCSKEIQPIEYGKGWLWVCCGKVIHNSSRLDEPKRIHEEKDVYSPDKKT